MVFTKKKKIQRYKQFKIWTGSWNIGTDKGGLLSEKDIEDWIPNVTEYDIIL